MFPSGFGESVVVMKKLPSGICERTVWQTLFKVGEGAARVGFAVEEKDGTRLRILQGKNGNLKARSRVGVSGWKVTWRNNQEEVGAGEFCLTDLTRFMLKAS